MRRSTPAPRTATLPRAPRAPCSVRHGRRPGRAATYAGGRGSSPRRSPRRPPRTRDARRAPVQVHLALVAQRQQRRLREDVEARASEGEGVPLEEDVGAVRDEHARHGGRQRLQARRVPHVPQAVAPEAPVRAPQRHAAVGPRADLEDVEARVARGGPPQDRVHHVPRRRDDADEGVGVRHAEAAHRDLAAAPVARQRVAPRRDRGVREADDEERLVGRRAGEREEGRRGQPLLHQHHPLQGAGQRRDQVPGGGGLLGFLATKGFLPSNK